MFSGWVSMCGLIASYGNIGMFDQGGESLKERYSSLPDEDLIELYENKKNLVEGAEEILLDEINRRSLIGEAIKELETHEHERQQAESSSGQGSISVLPQELSGWNWGAFLLSFIWGVRHRTYISLLALIPGVNIIMMFVLGFKGNEWAWKNNSWESIEHFKETQDSWAKWGVGILIVSIFIRLLFELPQV